MPLTFPSSPTNNQTYVEGGRTWQWNGTTWKIVTGALGAGSVNTTELANNAVTTAKIAAGAVEESDLANGAVTSSKLASGAAVSNIGFTPASTGKSIAMSIVFGG